MAASLNELQVWAEKALQRIDAIQTRFVRMNTNKTPRIGRILDNLGRAEDDLEELIKEYKRWRKPE